MNDFILKRISSNPDGVFGVLIDAVSNAPFAVTVEPEDKGNKKGISCIPPGTYKAFIRTASSSSRKYDTLQLKNVPNRVAIQIHKGIDEDSSEGCIIVGEYWESYRTKSAAVMQSTKGFNELMTRVKALDKEEIEITIEKRY